jgi:hypothetical protein
LQSCSDVPAHHKRPLTFALVLFFALGVLERRVAHAGDATALFGVDLGTPAELVRPLVSSSLSCQDKAELATSVVCRGGFDKAAPFAIDSTTFWLDAGRVKSVYQLSLQRGRRYAEVRELLRQEVGHVSAVLGRRPSVPVPAEPLAFQGLPDDQKLAAVVANRLESKAVWKLPGREIGVALLGDKGFPAIVISLDRGVAPHCDPESTSRRLMRLFPPAPVDVRATAARELGACGIVGAAGALAAAANASPEKEARIEVAHALGALGTMATPELEGMLAHEADGEVAKEVLEQMVQLGDVDRVHEIAGASNPKNRLVQTEARKLLQRASESAPVARAATPPAVKANPVAAPPAAPLPPSALAPLPRTESLRSTAPSRPIPPAPLAESSAPTMPAPPAEPAAPAGPPDGTALALTTSLVAGGVWGGGLSLLAQQSSPSVVLLVGSAGAVIGGGTAWGLTHFGLRPSPSQALTFANSAAWGTLAGLAAWAGSGSDNPKLKWGLLVGGESAGMGLGVLAARAWDWRPSQILLANTLVLGTGLALAGGGRLARPNHDFVVPAYIGYSVAPVMLASALASRHLDLSSNDMHMMGGVAAASTLTAGLLSYGLDTDASTRTSRLRGGLMLGAGLGYLGAVAISPLVEVAPGRTWASMAALGAGNLIGLGAHMVASPNDNSRWSLGAGLGGVSLGLGAFLAFPHLRLGEQAAGMSGFGALYGAGTWGLAMAASDTGQTPMARTVGGMLALGTAGGVAGLTASGLFHPTAADYATTMAGAAAGATAGIGVAKLATQDKGTGEWLGSLTGSALGLGAGALFSHATTLRPPDLGAAALGAGLGALAGSLVPSLADAEWSGFERKTTGGLLLGLSGGAVGSAALAHLAGTRPVTLELGAAGTALGLGMGLGTGLLWPDAYSQPARIGALAGTGAGMAGALLLGRTLHLDQGLGDSAASLGLTGALLGTAQGILVAGVADPSGEVSRASTHALWGGALLGGSAGLASGLVLSSYFAPDADSLVLVAAGDVQGAMFARGLSMTLFDQGGRSDTLATFAGSLVGMASLALLEGTSPLQTNDLLAGGLGMGYGGLVGALAPSLGQARWNGFDRRSTGGLLLGLGGGALASAGLAHVTGPRPVTLTVGALGGVFGASMGLGAGLLAPTNDSQPARIGVVTGLSAGVVGSLLLERPLHLDRGLGLSAPGLAATGAGIGLTEGVLLAGLVDPSGQASQTPVRQLWGGALLGGSLGLASGLVLSGHIEPTPSDLGATLGAGLAGGLFGRGLSMVATDAAGRGDTIGTMAGSLAGVAMGATMERFSPLSSTDFLAGGLGAGYGGLVGALAPTLADSSWGGWGRRNQGGLLLGLSGGAMSAAVLAHASGVSPRTLGLGALGGLDGALTGVGVGLLVDDRSGGSQGTRIGAVAGATGGLTLGLTLWPRLQSDDDNLLFLSAASAVGGWTGYWAPLLGHASGNEVSASKHAGGLLAGAGGMSILTSALLPSLHVERDLTLKALALGGLFSGAGAGAGALASGRDDAPVWGMLGGGSAGLLLGGALHRSLDADRGSGLLALGALEGLWAGAWLPYTLGSSADVTDRDRVAGVAAGGLGGAGLALLASAAGAPSAQRLGMAGIGSGVGASLIGGSVLLSDDLRDQRGVGIMLGGTAAGLGLGALVAPYVRLDTGAAARLLGGAGLGLAEGLAFAWSGRATTSNDYAGAGLIGAGLGATLGLASGADATGLSMQQTLVATGFSAWGTWIGSFSGAFANRDSHEVVLGGLAAANLGYAAGYAALRFDLVDTRDFGWLSLAGAMGTAVGGGVGAALSTSSNPRPVLAGLALGPLVGIGVGSVIVPRLRSHDDSSVSFVPARKIAPAHFELSDPATSARPAHTTTSADVLAAHKPSTVMAALKRVQRNLFDVTNWTPVMGALPPLPDDPNPAPFFIGVSGGLR